MGKKLNHTAILITLWCVNHKLKKLSVETFRKLSILVLHHISESHLPMFMPPVPESGPSLNTASESANF